MKKNLRERESAHGKTEVYLFDSSFTDSRSESIAVEVEVEASVQRELRIN